MDELIIKAIENNFDEKTIYQFIFEFYKDDKETFGNYDKIRIGISEEIFRLFMKIAEDFEKKANNYDEYSQEWRDNKMMYIKIYNLCLKLKDAKYKDKVMKLVVSQQKANSNNNQKIS